VNPFGPGAKGIADRAVRASQPDKARDGRDNRSSAGKSQQVGAQHVRCEPMSFPGLDREQFWMKQFEFIMSNSLAKRGVPPGLVIGLQEQTRIPTRRCGGF
jgi:hypothetical protein